MRRCTYLEQRSNYVVIMDERDMEQSRARAHDVGKDQGVEQESGGDENESVGVCDQKTYGEQEQIKG